MNLICQGIQDGFDGLTRKAELESNHSALDPRSRMCGVVLLLRCLHHYAGQLSAQLVPLPQSYVGISTALIKKKKKKTLIHAHTNSRTLSPCDVTVVSPEAGEFVELIMPCHFML